MSAAVRCFSGSTAIHFVWLQGERHLRANKPHLAAYVDTWKAAFPEWTLTVWDDASIQGFLQAHDAAVLEQYLRVHRFAQRSDLARYAILLHVGGMYVDTDMECLRPFGQWLDTDQLSLVYDSSIVFPPFDVTMPRCNNCWMYAPKPRLGAMAHLVKHVLDALRAVPDWRIPLSSLFMVNATTGPSTVWSIMKDRPDVTWVSAALLEPIRLRTANWKDLPATELMAKFPDAWAVHRPEFSWTGDGSEDFAKAFACGYQGLPVLAMVLLVLVLGAVIATGVLGSKVARQQS
jgi:hypothetical protein